MMKKTAIVLTVILSLTLIAPSAGVLAEKGGWPGIEGPEIFVDPSPAPSASPTPDAPEPSEEPTPTPTAKPTNTPSSTESAAPTQTAQPSERPSGMTDSEWELLVASEEWEKIFEQNTLPVEKLLSEADYNDIDEMSYFSPFSADTDFTRRLHQENTRRLLNILKKFTFTKTKAPAAPPEKFERAMFLRITLSDDQYYVSSSRGYRGIELVMLDNEPIRFLIESVEWDPIGNYLQVKRTAYYYTVNDRDTLFNALVYEMNTDCIDSDAVSYTNLDPEKGTIYRMYDKKEVSCTLEDQMKFDIAVDASYEGTEIGNVSGGAGTVHCTVSHYSAGESLYILTLSGANGQKEFYCTDNHWDYSGISDPLLFYTKNRVTEDGRFIRVFSEPWKSEHLMQIRAEASGGQMKNVQLKYKLDTSYSRNETKDKKYFTIPNTDGSYTYVEFAHPYIMYADAKNMTYEYFGDEESEMSIYYYLFQQYSHEERSDTKKEDDNKTKLPESGKLGYWVAFAGQLTADTSSVSVPTWAKTLGVDKNAEITLVDLLTVESRPRGDELCDNLMLKIKGEKGEQWFRWVMVVPEIEEGPDGKVGDAERMIYFYLQSIPKFDDFTKGSEAELGDPVELWLIFTDETRSELESISLSFGGDGYVTIPAEKMNYIGDAKAMYNRWNEDVPA